MHGQASPGACQVNQFHSGQPGLCTQTMANKFLAGGIFPLSMTFGTSLTFFTRLTLLKTFGILEGTKRSKVVAMSAWHSPIWGHLLSTPHIKLIHWESKTNDHFFSPPAVLQPVHFSGVDGPALSQRVFPIATLITQELSVLINDQQECSETERKAPRNTIFRLTEASRITIYSVTSLWSQGGVEK